MALNITIRGIDNINLAEGQPPIERFLTDPPRMVGDTIIVSVRIERRGCLTCFPEMTVNLHEDARGLFFHHIGTGNKWRILESGENSMNEIEKAVIELDGKLPEHYLRRKEGDYYLNGRAIHQVKGLTSPRICNIGEFMSTRARLENKPSWDEAPEGARILTFNRPVSRWVFGSYVSATLCEDGHWLGEGFGDWFEYCAQEGQFFGDAADSLKHRPEPAKAETPKIDWSKAPKGATHGALTGFRNRVCWYKNISESSFSFRYDEAGCWTAGRGKPFHGPLESNPDQYKIKIDWGLGFGFPFSHCMGLKHRFAQDVLNRFYRKMAVDMAMGPDQTVVMERPLHMTTQDAQDSLNEMYRRMFEQMGIKTMSGNNKLKKWQCFKKVEAGKIVDIHAADPSRSIPAMLVVKGDGGNVTIAVTDGYMLKHKPQVGGYYVRYEGGYESYSPSYAFEGGYIELSRLRDTSESSGGMSSKDKRDYVESAAADATQRTEEPGHMKTKSFGELVIHQAENGVAIMPKTPPGCAADHREAKVFNRMDELLEYLQGELAE